MSEVFGFPASSVGWAMAGAFCLGVSKAGFPGLAIVNVLIIAELFGARESVGIILPLLIVCDLIVYPMFRRHGSWRQAGLLLAPTLAGITGGVWLLARVDNATARTLIGGIILGMLALQLLREWRQGFLQGLPDSRAFRWASGLAIGVSTMLANAAGAVYSLYALVHRLTKEEFLGIGARFFLLVNLLKFPLLAWGIPGVGELALIDSRTLGLDLLLLPVLACGILAGWRLLRRVPQRLFEWLLYAFSLLAGLRLALG